MVTGRGAFHRDSRAATLSAVIRDDPEPLTKVISNAPRSLEKIVTRCLRKDPEWRFQTTADLRGALAEVTAGIESDAQSMVGSRLHRAKRWLWILARDLRVDLERLQRTGSARVSAAGASGAPVSRAGSRKVAEAALATAAMLMIGGAIFWYVTQHKNRLALELNPVQLTTNSAELEIESSALSPDGKYVAYSDHRGIHLRVIASNENHVLPQTAGYRVTSWFPDATRMIAVLPPAGEKGGIFAVSLLGGQPRRLHDTGQLAQASPDGSHIAFVSADKKEIWMMRAAGEDAHLLRSMPEGFRFVDLTWKAWMLRGCQRVRSWVLGDGGPTPRWAHSLPG